MGGIDGAAAELIADGGAAARSDDFFRSPPFLAAEGTTHTLRVLSRGRTAYAPLIVRAIDGTDRVDATSPYGYPGARIEGNGPAPAAADVDWSATGLVTVFGRERLDAQPWLADARERSVVLVHDPARPRRVRARLREQIRANERSGWRVETTPGAAAAAGDREAFARAYEQTMRRAGADRRYFFGADYLDAALSFERGWLVVAKRDGAVGAAAIAAVSDALLHYFLGATADEARAESPFKNVVAGMLDLADELGLRLNLGGGVRPKDGLEGFKRGFANAQLPFLTHDVVCDRAEYERLGGPGPDEGGFFPAYRAG